MIGLITVNYNQYKMTREFLESLKKVNNASKLVVYISDLSTQKEDFDLRKKYPFEVIMQSHPNLGYAYGINQGVKTLMREGVEKFCAINNDIFFDKNFADEADKGFIDKDIFGGKIYYAPGYEYHKKYKKSDIGKVIWYAGGIDDWDNVFTYHRGVDEVDRGQFDEPGKTDFITGCMFFFNRKVVERIGLWEEKYFLYYEDADYCERAKIAGFELIYNPKIIIYHKNAQSTGGSGSTLHRKYQRKNRVLFGLKYAPFRTKLHLVKNYLMGK